MKTLNETAGAKIGRNSFLLKSQGFLFPLKVVDQILWT